MNAVHNQVSINRKTWSERIKAWLGISNRRPATKSTFQPRLESLEERDVPSYSLFGNLYDGMGGYGGGSPYGSGSSYGSPLFGLNMNVTSPSPYANMPGSYGGSGYGGSYPGYGGSSYGNSYSSGSYLNYGGSYGSGYNSPYGSNQLSYNLSPILGPLGGSLLQGTPNMFAPAQPWQNYSQQLNIQPISSPSLPAFASLGGGAVGYSNPSGGYTNPSPGGSTSPSSLWNSYFPPGGNPNYTIGQAMVAASPNSPVNQILQQMMEKDQNNGLWSSGQSQVTTDPSTNAQNLQNDNNILGGYGTGYGFIT